MIEFNTDVFQNQFLPIGGSRVNAIVTVTAAGADAGEIATVGESQEILIIDASGSMSDAGKMNAAKVAGCAAIDCIRDGVLFAVIAGRHHPAPVYPRSGLVVASPQTREAAKAAVAKMRAHGGTAIGEWLHYANVLFGSAVDARCHAILLTDGQNGEDELDFMAALSACEGRFQCDCRGVGTDWWVDELREIASRLLGTVDIIPDPAGMAEDFASMMAAAMERVVGRVALRVWSPLGAHVVFLKQVSPTLEDLTPRRAAADDQSGDYPTGAWANEARDYHLCVEVPPQQAGEEMLAARVCIVVAGNVTAPARILATWTDDLALSTQLNREVAHYTNQEELADAIQEGLAARAAGEHESAVAKLGRAVQLADACRNEESLRLLSGVVDIEDAPTGTVRLKQRVEKVDEMTLDTRSTMTVRVQRSDA